MEQAEQTRSAVAEQIALRKVPEGQVAEQAEQTRSAIAEQVALRKVPEGQVAEQTEQTRSAVAEQIALRYLPESQAAVVQSAQTRFCATCPPAWQAVVSYWLPAVHVVHAEQTRSAVSEQVALWKVPGAQAAVVQSAQTRFCATCPPAWQAVVSYWPAVHVVHAEHSRFVVAVQAVLSYSPEPH